MQLGSPVQTPFVHASFIVQTIASLHGVPSALGVPSQTPVSHSPLVQASLHAVPSGMGKPPQTPPLH